MDKHSKHFHDQRKILSPFFSSVDGMLGNEALVVLANLSQLMAAKMKEFISHVHGWINGCIQISVAILYSCMIRGYHIPIPIRDRDPNWELVLGIGLAQ